MQDMSQSITELKNALENEIGLIVLCTGIVSVRKTQSHNPFCSDKNLVSPVFFFFLVFFILFSTADHRSSMSVPEKQFLENKLKALLELPE